VKYAAVKYAKYKNPTTDEEHLRNTALVVGGLAVLVVGYFIYKAVSSSSSTTATAQLPASGGGTTTGQPQSMTLTNTNPPTPMPANVVSGTTQGGFPEVPPGS
jgi:hypothetical protein